LYGRKGVKYPWIGQGKKEINTMKQKTESNLSAAFAGESQAHMKYMSFADRATQEGFANIARLFRAASYAEQIHATSHLKVLGQIKSTADNLQAAFAGETHEINEMYPSFIADSEAEGEKSAIRSESWALEAEKVHASLYSQALESIKKGGDVRLGDIHICSNCGWTVQGEAPDVCPLCKAKKEAFKKF
jgi:rubrerythrin